MSKYSRWIDWEAIGNIAEEIYVLGTCAKKHALVFNRIKREKEQELFETLDFGEWKVNGYLVEIYKTPQCGFRVKVSASDSVKE